MLCECRKNPVCIVQTPSTASVAAQGSWRELVSPGIAEGLWCQKQSSERFHWFYLWEQCPPVEAQHAGLWDQDVATPPCWCAANSCPLSPLSLGTPTSVTPHAPISLKTNVMGEFPCLADCVAMALISIYRPVWSPHLLKSSAGCRCPWSLTWSHIPYQKPSLWPFQRIWSYFELLMKFQNKKHLSGPRYLN